MFKVVCCLVAVLATTHAVFSEEPVHFNDPNLKAAVEEALGVSNPTPADMLNLHVLTTGERNVRDLTGLEYATELRKLYLYCYRTGDVSALSHLTNLTWLTLMGWQITDISPLSALTNLTWLDLVGCPFSDMSPLAGLTRLTTLTITGSQVSDLSPLSGLTDLTYLYLCISGINDVAPLSSLINLTELYLGEGNNISNISPLASLTHLHTLDLGANQISDISVLSNLTDLTWLNLYDNQVKDISSLAALSNLISLDLQLNPLNAAACATYIPQIVANNPGIRLDYIPCGDTCTLVISMMRGGLMTNPAPGASEYNRGRVKSVFAVAEPGSRFLGWTGTAVDAGKVSNPAQGYTLVTMDDDYTLVANFEPVGGPLQYGLTVSASAGGYVSEPGEGRFAYEAITTVPIVARTYTGYRFSGWTGMAVSAGKVVSPASESTTVMIDGDYSLQANFVRSGQFSVKVLAPNGGESLTAGDAFAIRWQTQAQIATLSIDLTVDGGSTWTHVSSPSAGAGSYDWSIPKVDSDRCLIRISVLDNAAVSDVGDAFFSIHKPLGHIWYVDAAAAPGGDGTSWETAFVYLQDGLARAVDGDSVWVAEGLYWPDLGGGQVVGDRAASFRLKNGVSVCGCFPTGAAAWERRNPFLHQSILSGDIGKPNVAIDNSYHVVTGGGTDKTAILDGCTITGGSANGSEPQDQGAGLYILRGSPQIRNCIFVGNTAAGNGGGACNVESNAAFINCLFNRNNAGNCGGGLYHEQGNTTVTNCTFVANQGLWRGGGVFNAGGTGVVTNCILWANGRMNGGLYDDLAQVSGEAKPTLDHCCVEGWTGSLGGPGNFGQDPLFVDPNGPDDAAGTSDDDLRLQAGSRCIDGGNNAAVPPEVITDQRAEPRIINNLVDIGAYEFGPAPTPSEATGP